MKKKVIIFGCICIIFIVIIGLVLFVKHKNTNKEQSKKEDYLSQANQYAESNINNNKGGNSINIKPNTKPQGSSSENHGTQSEESSQQSPEEIIETEPITQPDSETVEKPDWYKKDFQEINISNYVEIFKSNIITSEESIVNSIPEWLSNECIFYPDDAEFDILCYRIACDIYGDISEFEQTEDFSKYGYENLGNTAYTINGRTIIFVYEFDYSKFYVYDKSEER